mgnify:CR=1 FL=1
MLLGSDVLLGPDPPDSDYLEAYRQLRASLLALRNEQDFRSVLITSASDGEGKSTVALNLGTVLAFSSRSSICVDLDLHRPALHEPVGVPLEPGITDVLSGRADLEAAIHDTGIPGLQFISAGSQYQQRADILGVQSAEAVFERISESAEFIIVDSAPVLDFAVSQELARMVDMCIVVARARRGIAAVVGACEMLEDVGGVVAGIVVNDILPEDSTAAAQAYYEAP